ncbi:MAG: VCBS repeat-containing protein [Candidatus Tectomicrobia bacterium]|nr:VCBS repeat-containing protein [Candidatus Tectomicrobia bacterium]
MLVFLNVEEDPTLRTPSLSFWSLLKVNEKPINVETASPWVADVNGDGLVDLLVGDATGQIWLALNEGTPEAPRFGELMLLFETGQRFASPILVDWNQNGEREFLVGSEEGL